MTALRKSVRYKKIILVSGAVLVFLVVAFFIIINSIIEPIIRSRLQTLIVKGSDSLYTYTLGNLKANFYGGNVEVENLQIRVDSNRYYYLQNRKALPFLTMQMDLKNGHIRGVGMFSLLLKKKITIDEIHSTNADIKIYRNIVREEREGDEPPLWKAIQPDIKSISVDMIRFDGLKFLYKHVDTTESLKLQFDRCDAKFLNILIDSSAKADTNRISYAEDIVMRFHDLKFRTADSSYKMKAEWITYSSKEKFLEIDSFKLQPTLEKEDFYRIYGIQKPLYYVEFTHIRFVNSNLERFIHYDVLNADSLILTNGDIEVYKDKSAASPDFQSKIGKFPHQLLLKASNAIDIKNIIAINGRLKYTEKSKLTNEEASIVFNDVGFKASHVTNDPGLVKQHPVFMAEGNGKIFNTSPFAISFRFYLDSVKGDYHAKGWVKNVSAQQLNTLSLPLANVVINSMNLSYLGFDIKGEDYSSLGNVRMQYNDLALTIRERDEETGVSRPKKFINKMLKKFVLWPSNPGISGVERVSDNKKTLRLTLHSFFGQIWKTIYAGMQDIMMKSGSYE